MLDILLDSTTFWVAIAFVMFVAFSFKAAKKAMTGWLDGKIGKIQHDLDEAARLRQEAEALLHAAKARHTSATAEAQQIIDSARDQALALTSQAEAETQKQLARREQQVVERIALAERQALSDVQRQTVAAALSVVREMLARELTPQQKEQLAQAAVNDISKVA